MSSPLVYANITHIENNHNETGIIDKNKSIKNNYTSENSFYYKDTEINFFSNWAKIHSTGMGFHVIYALKVLKINAPIPTIQYHNFFPFRIDLFITWCRYFDENATTIISPVIGDNKPPIEGNHSFIIAFLKIPTMNPLRHLLNDGIIDGIQPWQQKFGKLSFAYFLRCIRDLFIDEPIIDICDPIFYFFPSWKPGRL